MGKWEESVSVATADTIDHVTKSCFSVLVSPSYEKRIITTCTEQNDYSTLSESALYLIFMDYFIK